MSGLPKVLLIAVACEAEQSILSAASSRVCLRIPRTSFVFRMGQLTTMESSFHSLLHSWNIDWVVKMPCHLAGVSSGPLHCYVCIILGTVRHRAYIIIVASAICRLIEWSLLNIKLGRSL
jgi:hypothetical protein